MTPIKRNQEGAASGMLAVLAVIAVLLLVILAVSNGVLNFGNIGIGTPSLDSDYSETVTRRATDVGILVPIEIQILGTQEAGDDWATLDITLLPYHETSGSDKVPNAEAISSTEFDAKVGGKGADQHFAVNGEPFKGSSLGLLDTTLASKNGVSVGYSQNNYQAWSVPASPAKKDETQNIGIYLWTTWEHRVKNTNQVLESGDVKLLWNFEIPAYNADNWKGQSSYTAYFFVPFTDYAAMEDIFCRIVGFSMHADITWCNVKVVKWTIWDFPFLSKIFGEDLEWNSVKNVDVPTVNFINYDVRDPLSYGIANNADPYSHSYTYKIR